MKAQKAAQAKTRAPARPAAARTYEVAVIPGDGTGPEVIREGRKVLEAAARLEGFRLAYEAGRIPKKPYASASSPVEGVVAQS